ncbi:Uncharacterized protein PECH_002628 [Penicillium ucsense]|uniref:Uncharacterized protein n=1 Tax=Penicillium ucsense TaxID=2839758 RepID=A0A8J8W9F4_9EURO|nr:Uncharacterized protein PECM_000262 [Penicillium ucsense]KAF7730604.1 Uncharacterized protein PECH_002628 [Penicillium ucsense]
MDTLRQRVDTAQAVFDNYNGGLLSSLELGRSVWDVYSSTKSARSHWDAAAPFEGEEIAQILVSYHAMRRSIAGAVASASSKGSTYDKSGVRLMAVGMLQMFENERSNFQQAARAKIPESFHDSIAGPVANLGKEFESAMRALS